MPNENTLFKLYLEMGYDTFCAFDGISGEGRKLAMAEWKRRKRR